MSGRLLGSILLVCALVAGVALYYLQIYAFYDRFEGGEIRLTTLAGTEEPMLAEGVTGIDAGSSPIRFRACFTTSQSLAMLSETYESYPAPEPLLAPRWFGCFDAEEIAEGIASGQALAFLGGKNVAYGVDRVVAVFADGRAFAWNQLNDCGQKAYDGTPVGEACPPLPAPGQ